MISDENVKKMKGLGFLQDKNNKEKFNARVVTGNGKISAENLAVISTAAKKFGTGDITMTTRLSLEIQGVDYNDIDNLREYLGKYGLLTGGTGAKVRPVVSCKGTTCQYGLLDSYSISQEIHEKFYLGYSNVKLPHKFKIAVGGCPNNCVKPNLNDIGIVGQRVPQIDIDKCHGCKICQIEKACPINVPKVVDGKVFIDKEQCNSCGRCYQKCPFKAAENYQNGYKIYIGGRWGKRISFGKPLSVLITDRAEVINIVEKSILLFKQKGIQGERFSDTINRLGFDTVEKILLSNDILKKKQEILSL